MRPYVIIHNAVSVNGMLTGFDVDMGVYYRIAGTLECQADLVGSGTILAAPEAAEVDDPLEEGPADPGSGSMLVIPDSRGAVRCWGMLQRSGYWSRFVCMVSGTTPAEHLEYLKRRGVDIIRTGDDRVDLAEALKELGARHSISRVRTDAGGSLDAALLAEGLVDEVSLLVVPVVVSPDGNTPLVRGALDAVPLALVHEERLEGGHVWLRYEVVRP